MHPERTLCETCKSEDECFMRGIFEKTACENYDPFSMDELEDRDRFVNAILIGDCPECSSNETHSCENDPFIDNITIGGCAGCGAYWCSECGLIFEKGKTPVICPHVRFCDKCMKESGYLEISEFIEKICPECEHQDEESGLCGLEDPSECGPKDIYQCPYDSMIMDCPKIKTFLKNL